MKQTHPSHFAHLLLLCCAFLFFLGLAWVAPFSLAGEERFQPLAPGIILDRQTGLQWLVGPGKSLNWSQAGAWVQSLPPEEGWRLPVRGELKGLYQQHIYPHHLHPLFRFTDGWVWTGESHSPLYAWAWCFFLGGEMWIAKDASYSLRAFAVRAPQSPEYQVLD